MAENQELNIIVKLTDQASKGLKSMSDSLDIFWKKIDEQTKWAQTFTKAVLWTATVVGGVSVKKFMDFEKTMSWVKAVLSPTWEEFDKLNEKAKQLGKDSIYSQSEVAQSIEMLAKNGLNATQILNWATDATINLAAATGTDLSTAADLATDTMAIFGIEAKNMSKAIDGITGVAVASKFTIDDYRLALAQGWWVAKAVWVSFDDFNASIAAISPLFASGSDAWTSFKVFLQRLIPASGDAAKTMKQLWLMTKDWTTKFFDATGKLKSMKEIAGLLQNALKDLSDEQKNQALQTIFGTDAMRAAAALADVGAEKFAKLNEQIKGTNAAEQAKIRLDNLSGSFEQLMGTLDVILIDFWKAISVVLRPAIDWLTNALNDMRAIFQGLSPEMQTLLSVIGWITAGFAGLLLVVGSIWIVLPAITTAISTITSALSLLMSPIWLVILIVIELVLVWKTNFLWIRDITKQVFEALKYYFWLLWDNLLELWEIAKIAFEGFKNTVSTVFEALKKNIITSLETIKNFWNAHFTGVKTIINGAWEIIKGVFQGAFNIINGILKIFAGLFTGNWKLLWAWVVSIAVWFWETIKRIFSWAFLIIQWVFIIFSDAIKAIWNVLWETFKLLTEAGWNAIVSIVNLAFESLKWLVNLWGQAISGVWKTTMEGLKNIVSWVWDSIKNIFSTGINWIIDKVNGIIGKVNKVSGKIWLPLIPTISPVKFQNGWIVPGFQTWGIIPGGKLPANHDQIPAMLDPGELILNRAQQKNLAWQIMNNQNQNQINIILNMWWVTVSNKTDADYLANIIQEKIVRQLQLYKLWIV